MPQLSKEQILFINQLTDNLTKEFELLNDALSGRAQHRASLVEKAANEINANQIGAVLLVLGVAAPVIFAIKGGALLLGRGAGYIYNRAQRSILTLVSNAYLDHTPEAGNQLIKETAKDAAYIYEYALNKLIDSQDIAQFARVGAKRIIEYCIRQKINELSEEKLLAGLLQGKSGAGIEQFTNNDIRDKNGEMTLTAEGLYGRAAYRTPDGKLWANADRNDLEIQQRSRRLGNSHFAWVALDEEGMPRYGYRLATYEEVQALNYTEFTPVPGKKCTQQFAIYQPKVKWVSEADIKNYFAARRDHYHGSFNDKLGAVARFAGILEDLDLRYCDFSESDFTDAEFINCQLDYCNFSKAHLVRTQWFNTSATHINLSLSQCAYLQAPRINFSHANFNDANFYAANLEDARLTHMTREGAHWDNVRINLEKSPEQDAPTAEQALTQLKEPKLNAHYDADQLLIWLRAQVQAVIATELEKQNFPEPLRTSFALLARNDLHYLNGHQAITFTCALIIKNGLGSEDREKIDRILQRVRATTALERKELRIATELNATDITLTQQAQIKMLLPPLQSHLNTACERLRTECDLSLGLDFSEARVLSLNGWVYETAQNQSVTEQISWQTAIFLGGNDELYTQYLEEVDRQEQPNIRTLLSTFAMPQDLFIQDDTNQSRQLDLQVYEKWQESLYYLARHHHLEWQSRSKMLDQLASKKLIHKQFAHDLLDIWWAWDNRHAHPPSSELLGFTAQLHAFWCQIVNETLSSAATQSSQLSPTEYLLQQAQRKGNWQAYCDYFAWRWTTAQNDVERNEILEGWKKNYTPLYRSQQITLMSVLDKVKSQEGDAYTKLFNHLLDVNDLTGWHYGLIYNRQQWLMRWQNAITSSAEDEVTLETPQLGIEHPASSRLQKHAMVPHVKEQMLDKIANTYTFKTPFQKANGMRDSLHAVYRFDHNGDTYWAKPVSAQPAIEYAVNEFMKRACGQSFLAETLISHLHIPGRKSIAVQWSQHIGGVPLIPEKLAEAHASALPSSRSFFVHLVRTLITGPLDDSHKDFRLVPDKDGQEDLFRFDYDQSFYAHDPKVKKDHVSQIKSMVLCLDNMHQALDLNDPIIQRFLTVSPLLLLEDWLVSLKATHQQYKRLFEHTFREHFEKCWGLFTEEECKILFPENNVDESWVDYVLGKKVLDRPSFSFLSVFLDNEVVIKINKLFAAIQSLLKYHQDNQKEITGMELALGVHNELGEYYNAIFQQVTYQENSGFSGLSTDVIQYVEKKFGRPVTQLPRELSPLLRFLERTQGDYNLKKDVLSNQDDRAMASSVLHFAKPLTLQDAYKISAGKDRSPEQAIKALKSIQSQNGFALLQRLKEKVSQSKEIEASITQFNQLSARHRSSLLACEIEKINDANLRKAAIKKGLCYTPELSAPISSSLVQRGDDVNGLFRAIEHELKKIDISDESEDIPYSASSLRTLAVSYMKKHGTSVPLVLNPNELKGEYFERMCKGERYGGAAEIEALAKALNIGIYVARAHDLPSAYGDTSNTARAAIYLWDKGNGHYHVLDLNHPQDWQTRLLSELIPGTIPRSLNLSGFDDLNDEHLRKILTTKPEGYTLTTGAFIERLDLSHNIRITYAAIMLIADHCPNIRELIVNNSAIGGFYWRVREFDHFKTTPVVFPKLEILSLKTCGNLSYIYLQAPHLKFLDASQCTSLSRIKVEGSLHGKANLTGCDQLPDLDYKQTLFFTSIDWPNLTPAVQTLLRAVSNKDYSPENLQLAGMDLSSKDISALCSALRLGHIPEIFLGRSNLLDVQQFFYVSNGTSTKMNFWGQLLGLSGFQYLASLLTRVSPTHLNLGFNCLDDDNAQRLAEVLKESPLTFLNLAENNITDVGARALCDALRNNSTLLHLNVTGNSISPPLLSQINLYLIRNQSKAGKLAKNKMAHADGSPALKVEANRTKQNTIFAEELLSQPQIEPAYSGILRRFKKCQIEIECIPGLQQPEALDCNISI